VRKQAGAGPAVTDIAVGSGEIRWTGTAEEAVPAAVNVTAWKGSVPNDLVSGFVQVDVDPLTAQETADAVNNLAPVGASGAAGSIRAGLALAVANIGPGSSTGYYTDTIDDGTSLLDGVRVQLYTAQNRVGPAYEAYTNALGVFEMWPDPGTYYRWLDYAGVSFAQDVTVVVTEP